MVNNYNIWHRKIQYVLEEQEVLKTLNHIMIEPEQGNILLNTKEIIESFLQCKKKE